MIFDVLHAFGLQALGDPTPLGTGITNMTYLVQTDRGSIVIQSLHPQIKDEAAEDMVAVTGFLKGQGVEAPILLQTANGKTLFTDSEGVRWRAYPYVDGVAHDALPSLAAARSAGEYLGKLHRALRSLSYEPKGMREHFHDTPWLIERLRTSFAELPLQEMKEISTALFDEIQKYYFDEEEKQLIHGDLKVSNLLFDTSEHVVGILDFDTLLMRSRFIDIGDALRSWCNRTREDDPNATFDADYFDAVMSGYEAGWGEPIDRDQALRATKLITLELVSRFLHDAVVPHFGWDKIKYASREESALARGRGQWHLASTIPI